MSTTVEALEQAAGLYDQLALSPLEASTRYGPNYASPTDEQCLEVRQMIESALPRAELEGQAVELMPRVLQALRTAIELIEQEMSGCETADETALMNLMDTILTQIEALTDGTTRAV